MVSAVHLKRWLLLACLIMCPGLMAQAQSVVQLTEVSQQKPVDIRPALTMLSDPQGRFTLDDVSSSGDFRPLTDDEKSMNFGYRRDALWFKLQLQSQADVRQDWLLAFEFAYLGDIRVYVIHNENTELMQAGLNYPIDEWPLAARQPIFPVSLQPGEAVTIFIRAQSQTPLMLNMALETSQQFVLSENITLVLLAVYFGMVLALGCYNFLLFLAMRQSEFLLYSGFVLTFGIAAAYMNGVGQLLLPWYPLYSQLLVPTGFALSAMLATLFARKFLSLRDTLPFWHKALGVLAVLWLAVITATPLVDLQQALELISVMAVIMTLVLLSAGIMAMVRGVAAAGKFVLAWTFFLLGIAVMAVLNAGFLPSNVLTVFAMQFGSAAEILLLSFTLAARFNDMKKQKESARQALVEAMLEHERELENRVAERTRQLEETKNRLQQMVHKDTLTGLPNRLGLSAYFDQLLQHSVAQHEPVAVMLIDLDGFKPVNDEHGHEAGDELLQNIAGSMKQAICECGVVGRLGGDEFVVVFTGFVDNCDVRRQAELLLQAISSASVRRNGMNTRVGASIGICFGIPARSPLKELIAQADEAMYEVKRAGKCGIAVFNDDALYYQA